MNNVYNVYFRKGTAVHLFSSVPETTLPRETLNMGPINRKLSISYHDDKMFFFIKLISYSVQCRENKSCTCGVLFVHLCIVLRHPDLAQALLERLLAHLPRSLLNVVGHLRLFRLRDLDQSINQSINQSYNQNKK